MTKTLLWELQKATIDLRRNSKGGAVSQHVVGWCTVCRTLFSVYQKRGDARVGLTSKWCGMVLQKRTVERLCENIKRRTAEVLWIWMVVARSKIKMIVTALQFTDRFLVYSIFCTVIEWFTFELFSYTRHIGV